MRTGRMSGVWRFALFAALCGLFGSAQAAHGAAQDRLEATEGLPHMQGSELRVRVLGLVLSQQGRLTARRAAARRRALARAKRRLHAWLDEALARRGASPAVASAVHASVDDGVQVVQERPLVDGSIVMVLSLPVATLSAAGLPSLEESP